VQAQFFDAAKSLVRSKRPHIVLLDLYMPGRNGDFKANLGTEGVAFIVRQASGLQINSAPQDSLLWRKLSNVYQ